MSDVVPWRASIAVGAHSWSVSAADPGAEVDDEPHVLDDLRIGWAMPKGGVYPDQPEAMSAEFSLSLPAFADYGELSKGDPVSIELRVPFAGPVIASFYGRVTDLRAKPRGDVPGVTLDVIAIDYTVDPLENLPRNTVVVVPTDYYTHTALQIAFEIGYGGALPGTGTVAGWPGVADLPTVWTSPTTRRVPGELFDNMPKQIAAVLLEAVDSADGTRMILAPVIVPDGDHGVPTTPRGYTIDTVNAHPDREVADIVLDADTVDIDVTWTQVKGDNPTRVVATYGTENAQQVAVLPGATEPYIDVPITLWLPEYADGRAAAIAAFYLPDDLDDNLWQIESVTYELDQLTPEQLDDVPTTLFPSWTLDEGDPARSACYSQLVWVDNVDPTVQPYPDGPFSGRLAGATAQVSNGALSITLALRAVRHHDALPI